MGAGPIFMPSPTKPPAVQEREPSLEQHARETFGFAKDWQVHTWTASDDRSFVTLEGGIYRHKKLKGKYKGETDYRKPDPGSEAKVSLRNEEHDRWLLVWELQTGFCSKCSGTGWEHHGWNHLKGCSFLPCSKCGASGLACREAANAPE